MVSVVCDASVPRVRPNRWSRPLARSARGGGWESEGRILCSLGPRRPHRRVVVRAPEAESARIAAKKSLEKFAPALARGVCASARCCPHVVACVQKKTDRLPDAYLVAFFVFRRRLKNLWKCGFLWLRSACWGVFVTFRDTDGVSPAFSFKLPSR